MALAVCYLTMVQPPPLDPLNNMQRRLHLLPAYLFTRCSGTMVRDKGTGVPSHDYGRRSREEISLAVCTILVPGCGYRYQILSRLRLDNMTNAVWK